MQRQQQWQMPTWGVKQDRGKVRTLGSFTGSMMSLGTISGVSSSFPISHCQDWSHCVGLCCNADQ